MPVFRIVLRIAYANCARKFKVFPQTVQTRFACRREGQEARKVRLHLPLKHLNPLSQTQFVKKEQKFCPGSPRRVCWGVVMVIMGSLKVSFVLQAVKIKSAKQLGRVKVDEHI